MKHQKIGVYVCDSALKFGKRVEKELKKITYVREDSYLHPDDPSVSIEFLSGKSIWFPNKEVKVQISKTKNWDECYILQLCYDPSTKERSINDNLMEALSAADALHRMGVDKIKLVIPQFPYSRQEKIQAGESLNARMIANFIESTQIDEVMTVDIHSEAIAGFFNKTRFTNINSAPYVAKWIKKNIEDAEDYTIVAPDLGSLTRAKDLAKELSINYEVMLKNRDINKVESFSTSSMIYKKAIIIDDMISNGDTVINACDLLNDKEVGTIKVFCVFPYFTQKALDNLSMQCRINHIDEVIGSDLVPYEDELWGHKWYKSLSLAELVARNII